MPGEQIYPKSERKEHFNLITFEKHGRHFEVDVNPDNAIAYREGAVIDLNNVLKTMNVYADVKKGLLASETDLQTVFGTNDIKKIAEQILKHGDIQLSQEYRQKQREAMYNKIINDVHRLAIDARTENPLPVQRIQNGLEEIKFKIKDNISYDKLFKEAFNGLKTVMPLKITNMHYELYFDLKYSDAILRYLNNLGNVLKKDVVQEKMHVIMEIPAGLKEEFFTNINDITHGTARIEKL